MTAAPKTRRFKPFSLRIIHKGLMLVILPLVVNTAWIVMLNNCLENTAHLAELERSQSILLQHINNSLLKFALMFGTLITYATTADPLMKNQYLSQMQDVREEFKALQAVSGYRATLQNFASELINTAETQFSVMAKAEIPNDAQSFEASFVKFKSFKHFVVNVGKTNLELQKHLTAQQKELDKIHRIQDEAKNTTRVVVLTGLAVNLVLAIALAYFFVSDITGRLKILVENANRLPRHLGLNHTITGTDELTELDLALHAAASELAKATQYRSSLMQMMAHDLRSPLASLMVSLELLARKNQETLAAGSIGQIKSITSSVDRLLTLINDLLLLDRLEHNEMQLDLAPENVKEVCQVAIDSVSGLAAIKQLTLQNCAEKDYIEMDRERILQVLVNFLSNAIKHSPSNGAIKLEALFTQLVDGQKLLRVAVSDQGPGLTKSEIAFLFEKFRQLKAGEKAGGSGLGLALSKFIVEAHGGDIGADGRVGQGSTFWFTLPLREDD